MAETLFPVNYVETLSYKELLALRETLNQLIPDLEEHSTLSVHERLILFENTSEYNSLSPESKIILKEILSLTESSAVQSVLRELLQRIGTAI